jgi:ribonuclease HI
VLVSLFSDASICNLNKVGGWAAWLKSDRGSIRTGSHFRTTVNDTSIAEAMAVVNGLVAGTNVKLIQPGDTVLVQTDNNAVMSVLEGTAKRKATKSVRARRKLSWRQLKRDVKYHNAEIRLIASAFASVTERYQLTIKWRHVKGHRGTIDKRSAVNTYCDKIAKDHMQVARKRNIKPREHALVEASAPANA